MYKLQDPTSTTLRRWSQQRAALQQQQILQRATLGRQRPYPPYYVNEFNPPTVSAIYEFPATLNEFRAPSVSSGGHIYMEVPDRRSALLPHPMRYFDDSGFNEESSDVTSGSNNNTRFNSVSASVVPSSSSSSFGTHRKRHKYVNDNVQNGDVPNGDLKPLRSSPEPLRRPLEFEEEAEDEFEEDEIGSGNERKKKLRRKNRD